MPGDPFYIDIFKKPSTKLMFTFFLWSRVAVFNRTGIKNETRGSVLREKALYSSYNFHL